MLARRFKLFAVCWQMTYFNILTRLFLESVETFIILIFHVIQSHILCLILNK